MTYSFEGGYHTFKALVGGMTNQFTNTPYTGHWWVVVEGQVVQGSFTLNRPPTRVEVPVLHAHELELRVTSQGESTTPTLVWGDAELS